jgi:hypothetical protein
MNIDSNLKKIFQLYFIEINCIHSALMAGCEGERGSAKGGG